MDEWSYYDVQTIREGTSYLNGVPPQRMDLDLATVGELAAHTVPAFGGAMI